MILQRILWIPWLAVVGVLACHGSRLPGSDATNPELPGPLGDGNVADGDVPNLPDSGELDFSSEKQSHDAPQEALDSLPVDPGGNDFGLADPSSEPGPDLILADPGTGDSEGLDRANADLGTPDTSSADNPIFRAAELRVVHPDFCFETGSGICSPATSLINDYLASAIGDPTDPLNLLFRLIPFLVQRPETDLLVGSGPCSFMGSIPIACAFSPSQPPTVFEGPLFLPHGCGPSSQPVPCFETAPKKVEMYFMGLFVAMHQAIVSGWIESGVAGLRITHGVLKGYVPVNTTKSLLFEIPGWGMVTLYDLVKHNPVVDQGGVKTFRFEFRFQADALAYLD